MTACTYCGCDVHAHDPVFVSEGVGDERHSTDAYCNYACLSEHIEEAGLTVGATCELDA